MAPPEMALAGPITQPGNARADRERRIGAAIREMRAAPSRPWTLDELAEAAAYSRFHFARSFRDVTGTSPGSFQAALRFARASELLLTSGAPVTEVCAEVGYASLGTFSDRFRELTGVSPTALRDLPDRVADLRPERHERRITTLLPDSGSMVVNVPEAIGAGWIAYIGLYPDGVAAGRPTAGAMRIGPGPVAVLNIPAGRYRALSAAFPPGTDWLGQLLPSDRALVSATGQTITVGTAMPPVALILPYRPARPTDPPILTALPALLLDRV